ncbi:MAG TPA: hypothetical protein VKP11_07830 [Frankiaceae bacterium]|nr:hypothetical protein [Frankiaceae bacterium]
MTLTVPRVAAVRRSRPALPEAVRATLPLWLASRVAVALLSLAGARVLTDIRADAVPGFRALWYRWDVDLFTKVARFGYLSPAYPDRTEVDFPGMPIAIRLAHLLLRDWVVSGLVVSLVAGAAASAALWRLSADEVGRARAPVAVLALVLFPYAVFLFAGYSEALFLAFATGAWLAARRQRWWPAGLLGAGAAATRLLGIPLCLALAVEYVVSRRRADLRLVDRQAPALLLPPLPVLAFAAYLHGRTGRWDAYTTAMREGWNRTQTWPWEGWRATWRAAFDGSQGSALAWFWRAELAAVVIGVVLTLVLARAGRWGEAAFVGGSTLLMSASSYYASGVRAVLVWFPLYLLLARVAARRPWLLAAYAWVCGPLMAVLVVAFTRGQWVD